MIQYRAGKKAECHKISEMIYASSDGVVEFLFHDLVADMSPIQLVSHNLANDDEPHSYKNTIIATEAHELVGMALSYPSSYHTITAEMREFFPTDRLQHLEDFYASRVDDSWFLDTLYVAEGYRKRGIGSKLLSLVEERAAQEGFKAVSLIVFAGNESAVRMYRNIGFDVVRKIKLERNRLIKHSGGCLLMEHRLSN